MPITDPKFLLADPGVSKPKDHPEIVAEMQEAMRQGLRAESSLTPGQIRDKLRRSLAAQDKPIRKATDLVAEIVIYNCSCGRADGYTLGMMKDGKRICYPWCESVERVEFKTEPYSPYKVTWHDDPFHLKPRKEI